MKGMKGMKGIKTRSNLFKTQQEIEESDALSTTYKTMKIYKESYTDLLVNHVNPIKTDNSKSAYYFITLIFNQKHFSPNGLSVGNGNGKQYTEFDTFHYIYNQVCHYLLGRNYHRNQPNNPLPTVAACIDVNGTKYLKIPSEAKNPHIHSVWKIDSFDIRMINTNDPDGIRRTVEYSSKYLPANAQDIKIEEDVRTYPLTKEYLSMVKRNDDNFNETENIHPIYLAKHTLKKYKKLQQIHFGEKLDNHNKPVSINQKIKALQELISKIRDISIPSLRLTPAIKHIFEHENIKTLNDLVSMPVEEIANFKGLNDKTILQIYQKIIKRENKIDLRLNIKYGWVEEFTKSLPRFAHEFRKLGIINDKTYVQRRGLISNNVLRIADDFRFHKLSPKTELSILKEYLSIAPLWVMDLDINANTLHLSAKLRGVV